MANGKVTIGYAFPMVAKYSYNGTAVTYTDARFLARGVDVSIQPDQASDSGFYADNMRAESDAGVFTGGTLSQTVDGLFPESETMIMGLPAATEDGFEYNDDQNIPYVAAGWTTTWQSAGVCTYTANVLYKVKYNQIQKTARTHGENTEYQTQALTARIERSDAAKHPWQWTSKDFDTEEEALSALKTKLGYTDP